MAVADMALGLMQMTRHVPQEALRQIAGAGMERLRTAMSSAHALPQIPGCTLGLLNDPYRFVLKTCARLGSDAFVGRVLFRRTLFLMGEDAALLFYNPQLMQRAGAAPLPLQRTLFGAGGLPVLDGAEHRRRKAMVMDLVAGPEVVQRFSAAIAAELRDTARRWPEQESVEVDLELRRALTRAACAWAGLALDADEVDERCRQLSALADPRPILGLPDWRGWWHRLQAERWCRRTVTELQDGRRSAPADSALYILSHYRDSAGQPLPLRDVAVELLNLLRPVVAVSVYAHHALMALDSYPGYRLRLQEDDSFLPYFAQEVRRFYPFFPQIAARTRQAFDWNGRHFPAGLRVLLDVYGTDHDPRSWEAPDVFHPERFLRRNPGAYSLVAQGGGDAGMHHRCPGEALTLSLIQDITRFFCREVSYELETALPGLDWSRLPPLPRTPLRLWRVSLSAAAAGRLPRRLAANEVRARRPQ